MVTIRACTIPSVTSPCGILGFGTGQSCSVQAALGIGTFLATAPACFSQSPPFVLPQLRLSPRIPPALCCSPGWAGAQCCLPPLPVSREKPPGSWRGEAPAEDARAWPGLPQPLRGLGLCPGLVAPPRCLIAGKARPRTALFKFPTEPPPAPARAVNPSHPGLSLPFCAHRARGDSEAAARLQHLPGQLPRLRGEHPQRVPSKRSGEHPTASPFCFCRGKNGF